VSWDSKVIWSEGLFLQPHHFQQADRYGEAQISGMTARIGSYLWGFSSLEIDQESLKFGKFAVTTCSGVTRDGAVFRVPQSEQHPSALEVPEGTKDCVVYLAVPSRRHGATEVDMTGSDASATRFRPSELEITDTMGKDRRPVTMGVATLRLQFALDVDDLADLLVIPVARIIEVRADKEIILDNSFIPSCMDVRAASALEGYLRELEGLLSHRMTALSSRLSDSGPAKGTAEIADFLLLITVNRWLPIIRHLLSIENVHPCELYEKCASLAGELSSFMATDKQPPEFPLYQHDNLTFAFAPVMRTLRQYLSAVLEQTAISIPLEQRKYGVSVGIIADKKLTASASFVVAVNAEIPTETVRRHFAAQAKVGAVEEIRQLVNSALPGIGLRPLPVAPRQIPYHAGMVYFELERDGPHWQKLTTSGGIAFHVSGDFPGLQMELWAIRQD